jgi:plastocyanin
MTTPRRFRTLAPATCLLLGLGVATAFAASGGVARAGTVRGTLRLPESLRAGRQHQGYWRLENGNVPVRSAPSRSQTVVVVDGVSGTHPPAPKTVTVEIAGLDAQPRVVVVGPGSVVEFKNVGKVTHELSMPDNTALMPIERLNPGTFRHQRFGVPGGYLIRCAQYPHLAISVIVVDSPFYAIADERGGFAIPGLPDAAKANLKVWSQGRWVHEQEVDTSGKQELTIRVAAPRGQGDAAKESEPKEGDPGADPSGVGSGSGAGTDGKPSAE